MTRCRTHSEIELADYAQAVERLKVAAQELQQTPLGEHARIREWVGDAADALQIILVVICEPETP